MYNLPLLSLWCIDVSVDIGIIFTLYLKIPNDNYHHYNGIVILNHQRTRHISLSESVHNSHTHTHTGQQSAATAKINCGDDSRF